MIVSHDEKGEYGHIQHKRVHEIAKYLSNHIQIPFMTFAQRYDAHISITIYSQISNV